MIIQPNKENQQKLKEIDNLQIPLEDWDENVMETIKVDITYNSNKIEGNALTYGETIAILKDGIKPKKRTLQDIFTIEQHKEFLDKMFDSYRSEFSVDYVRDLHEKFMGNPLQWAEGTGDNIAPGALKWEANYTTLENGELKYFMNAEDTPSALEDLCTFVNTELKKGELHPVIIASIFHQRFIGEIHPFVDGNGRIGRMLTNQILMKGGFSPATFDLNRTTRKEYIAMMNASKTEDPESMNYSHQYFCDMVLHTLEMKK